MKFKRVAAAACLAISTATAGLAAPVTFDFSYVAYDIYARTVATITGVIEGLDSNGLGQASSKITINDPDGSKVVFFGEVNNSFDVVNSKIDASTVSYYGTLPTGILELEGRCNTDPFCSAATYINAPNYYTFFDTNLTFSTGVSAVPLPAGGVLLLSGLVGAAGLKRRTKKTA